MGQIAPFSNRGSNNSIAAPAVGIPAAWDDDNVALVDGTSFAAPYVTGTIALLMSENPEMSAPEAVEIIRSLSNDCGAPGPDPVCGSGSLDISRVQNRNQKGIRDVAVGDHHIDTKSGDVELVVSAQNRGTELLPKVGLRSVVDGFEKVIEFEDVEVGETVSQHYPLDKEKLLNAEAIEVESTASTDGNDDSKQENDSKTSVIQYHDPNKD